MQDEAAVYHDDQDGEFDFGNDDDEDDDDQDEQMPAQ